MSIVNNNALKFLNMLDTKELFMNIDKSHKSKINCNLLFLKMKTYHGNFEYAIQENNSLLKARINAMMINWRKLGIPEDQELKSYYENIRKELIESINIAKNK